MWNVVYVAGGFTFGFCPGPSSLTFLAAKAGRLAVVKTTTFSRNSARDLPVLVP